MNVSIIIPVLNEYSALLKLIPSLINVASQHDIEIIVCDGGSSDLTCPYIRQWTLDNSNVQLFHSALGRAKQMNLGAKKATHECLLFLHADTQLPCDWPDLIVGKTWGRFNVRLSGQHPMFRVIEFMMNWRSCITQVATGDQAIFVAKTLFDSVNAYPDLPLMEDIALSKALRKQSAMHCIKTPLVTSSRRWQQHGVFRTVYLMWKLRLAYFIGVSPQKLAKQYYPNYGVKRSDSVLQIFSKMPIVGYVKTRLIPHVGEQSATDIHRYLLKHSLSVAQQSHIKNELWVAQEKQHVLDVNDEFYKYAYKAQQGNGLGDRMAFAIQQGLASHKKVVLMGTDCLDLTPLHIEQSLNALNNVDVVLTPVEDGGFISIACRAFDPRMFQQVAWGSSTALADVLHNLKKLSLRYSLLKPVRDIDTYDDVMNYSQLLNMIKS